MKKFLAIVLASLLLVLGLSGTAIFYHDRFIDSLLPNDFESDQDASSILSQVISRPKEKGERRKLLDAQYEAGEYDFNALFEGCLFVGDSRTVGMNTYGYLDSEYIVAEIGVRVDHLDWNQSKVVAAQPRYLIVSYGVNDAATYHNDVDGFIQNYERVLNEITAQLPDTVVFINSILPVQEDACPTVSNADVSAYNQALQELCNEYDYYYIDNDFVAEIGEEYFNGDGLHFQSEFYPSWLLNIAKTVCSYEDQA